MLRPLRVWIYIHTYTHSVTCVFIWIWYIYIYVGICLYVSVGSSFFALRIFCPVNYLHQLLIAIWRVISATDVFRPTWFWILNTSSLLCVSTKRVSISYIGLNDCRDRFPCFIDWWLVGMSSQVIFLFFCVNFPDYGSWYCLVWQNTRPFICRYIDCFCLKRKCLVIH